MQEDLIQAEEYAAQSHTDITFINLLNEYGLIEITLMEDIRFIPLQQLPVLEKYTRLHYELDINLEGIEAISHLLQKINTLQGEIDNLKNRARLYEPLW